MTRAILSATLAVAFVAGVSAQDARNFVGTWKIDPDKSDRYSVGGSQQAITVDGSKMTITRTVAGNTSETVYLLDGTPQKKMVAGRQGGEPRAQIHTSKWDGNVLITTIDATTVHRIEKRWIQADGTMRVEVNFIPIKNGQQGEPGETGWQVLNKIK